MAHSKQAKKRIRQDEKRNQQNRSQRSTMRTFIKRLEALIEAGAKKEIPAAFTAAMSAMHKNARKNIVSKGAINRKISRLAARIKKVA